MDLLRKGRVRKALTAFESRIGGALPPDMTKLFMAGDEIQFGRCRFADVGRLATLEDRVRGWPPELIPFAVTGADSYCLMRVHGQPPSSWPVVLGLAQPPNVHPIASNFRWFLLFLGLYYEPSAGDGKDGERARRIMAELGVPSSVLAHTVPPPQRPEEILKYDKQALVPRCIMALRAAQRGDSKAAIQQLKTIAAEAPWWGAPHYLMARLFQQVEQVPSAAVCYWNALERANCYSGFTNRTELGDLAIPQNAEAVAIAFLQANERDMPEQMRRHFRWQWIQDTPDHMEFGARFRLARHYVGEHQWERATWALLDALYLKWRDPTLATQVLHELAAVYDKLGRPFEASVCRA